MAVHCLSMGVDDATVHNSTIGSADTAVHSLSAAAVAMVSISLFYASLIELKRCLLS